MRYFALLTILSFLAMPLVGLKAETADPYADAVTQSSGNLLNPDHALNEPNGDYADFLDQNTSIKLDLGEGEEGIGDMKIYYTLLGFGATVRVEFYDEGNTKLDEWSAQFDIATEITAEYEGTDPYRYVTLVSVEEETWKLDAIEVLELAVVEEEEEEVEEEVEEETEETDVNIGMLVKLPDDGDPDTQYDSAVYEIGADGKRHAFPNENVFFSWYENFDDVVEITQEDMDQYPLGDNVTMRPGTYLIKIPTVADVFAVEHNGILRKLDSEQVAIDLYTEDWAGIVRDVAETFWTNYEVGEPIETAVHPDGTLLEAPSGEVVYLNNSTYYSVPGEDYQQMRFRSIFIIPAAEEIFTNYVDGGNIVPLNYMLFPY